MTDGVGVVRVRCVQATQKQNEDIKMKDVHDEESTWDSN